MSSQNGDGNVRAICLRRAMVRRPGQIVAETVSDKSLCRHRPYLRLDDGHHLSFGNYVVEANQDGFELARCGRSHRNFHLHRFDEGNVIQVVSRAFDVLRCFEGHEARLGNLEISSRCGLPRSTVSRLTHTLTRMGQLVYLPRDQKYRIGPSAVAMSTSMMRGLQLRNLIRLRLQDVAEQLPGTVGFVIPDRFHLVYLEFARAANALRLHETTGSRIAMASTAAGHAYTAALDADVGDALLAEMEREIPEGAKLLQPRIEANRRFLPEHGYVVACGLC